MVCMMKIAKVRLADQVADKILEMIANGIYKPGDKLPVENEIAELFSVSRVTVREAFVKLSMMGIVDIRQGDGTFVKKVSPESFMKPLLPMIILDKKNLVDIYVARLAIESKTAELAALNSTDQDISDLNDIMKLMENAYKLNDFEQYHINDCNFHLMIAKVGKNAILYKILEIIHDLLNYSIIAASEESSLLELSIKLHKLIIGAITDRDPDKAVEYMVSHLSGGLNYLKK